MKSLRKTFLALILLSYALGFTGAALNQLVIIENGGKFPVLENSAWVARDVEKGTLTEDGMTDNVHCLMTKDTHLNLLADLFNFGDGIYSIGDLMMMAGDSLQSNALMIGFVIVLFKKE